MRRGRLAALAGGLVAAAGTVAWGVEHAVVRRARRRPDPDAASELTLDVDEHLEVPTGDGGSIAVYTRGSGPPIVLSHGATLSARIWTKQFDDLVERGFRVVAYDHRGHGASGPTGDGTSPVSLADDLAAVLETLDLRDALVVGHSMGGIAVQSLANRHPELAGERVRGIVLLSTLARTMLGDPGRAILEQLAEHAPDFGWLFRRRDLGFALARIGFGRDPLPSHVELVRRLITECSSDTRHATAQMLMACDLTAELASILLPVLVVVGSADVLTPPAGARELADLIPDARIEVLDGGGHMLMLERADEVDDLIAKFASEVGATS